MTSKGMKGSQKEHAGREKRQHSPWPLIAVVAVPIISAALRLPMWVTLLLLVVGVGLLLVSPQLAAKHHHDPKIAWVQLMASYTKLQSAHAALKKPRSDAAARARFLKLKEECMAILNSRPDSDWGPDSGYAVKVRNDIESMSDSPSPDDSTSTPAPSKEIGQLADLQKQGLISDSEFQAFSEKFRILAAEKACGALETMAGLQLKCREGAMTEADFHAALRDLLDKLIRGEAAAAPKPATQA